MNDQEIRVFAINAALQIVGHKGSTELVLTSADEIALYIQSRPVMQRAMDAFKQGNHKNVL